MEDHRTTPDPAAFKEAVRTEDPAGWGARPHLAEPPVEPLPADRTRVEPPIRSHGTAAPEIRPEAMPHHGAPYSSAVAYADAEPPVERRRFSLGATFLGWAVAAFFTLVFAAAIAVATRGASITTGANDLGDAQGLALASVGAYVVGTFFAFLIGGYAAGRISLWDGLKHGLLTVAWSVLFTVAAVAGGAALAARYDLARYLPFDAGALTTPLVVTAVLTLLAQLLGAGLGGRLGERYHDRVHGIDTRERRRNLRGRHV